MRPKGPLRHTGGLRGFLSLALRLHQLLDVGVERRVQQRPDAGDLEGQVVRHSVEQIVQRRLRNQRCLCWKGGEGEIELGPSGKKNNAKHTKMQKKN